MIAYSEVDSPYYTENKNFCEDVGNKLQEMGHECSGYCNAWGYEFNSNFKRNNLDYNLIFKKFKQRKDFNTVYQYLGFEISIAGINKKLKLRFEKSLLKRFFASQEMKRKVPEPYCLSFNFKPDNIFIDQLLAFIKKYNIEEFKIKKGVLTINIHQPFNNPNEIINAIDEQLSILNNMRISI